MKRKYQQLFEDDYNARSGDNNRVRHRTLIVNRRQRRRIVRQRTWSEFGTQVAGAAAGAGLGAILVDAPLQGALTAYRALAPNLNKEETFLMKTKSQANNSYGQGKLLKNKKVHLKKPKKQPKISKNFKNKVQLALKEEGKSFTGSWRQFSYSSFAVGAGTTADPGPLYPGRQGVFAAGSIGSSPVGTFKVFANDFTGCVGNVQDWVYMLSVLYNGRAETQLTRDIASTSTLGNIMNPVGQVVVPGGSSTQSFENNLVFMVKNCYDVYRMRNNTGRSYTIDAYSCKPKADVSETTNRLILPFTATIEEGYSGTPPLIWAQALADQKANLVNFKDAKVYDYGVNPTATPNFKKYFDSEVTKIVLEPGESYEFKIQGVSNYKVDMTQRFKNGAFYDCGKFTRFPMFVIKTDLVEYATATTLVPQGVVRGGSILSAISSVGISCEREHYAQFEMPEAVGGLIVTPSVGVGALAQRTQLGNRFYHKVYSKPRNDTDATVIRIDDENPATQQTTV